MPGDPINARALIAMSVFAGIGFAFLLDAAWPWTTRLVPAIAGAANLVIAGLIWRFHDAP